MEKKSGNSVQLPSVGRTRDSVLSQLAELHDQDANWHEGRTWSLVYHANDEHTEFLKKAYCTYFHQNGLNPGAFPSLKKYEAEVVSIAANLFHGGPDAAGTMTSGGSESIMMAVKTYRDFAKTHHPEITTPEMIVPESIHPAFDKAAQYFQVKAVLAPLGADYRVDVERVKKLITLNTILLVGSAPQYPQGVMDPIQELAELAQAHGIGMHVDACVGGFFLPFAEKLGRPVPPWDFKVNGVTSITADLHKYGFAAKGASVVIYRDRELRRFQFFVKTNWPGGLFASPSMTGTRPAGSIAAAWATLQAFGEDGYLKITQEILNGVSQLQSGIRELGLRIIGDPVGSIFAFTSDDVDIFAIGDALESRHWHVDRQQNPNCIHLMVTPAHTAIIPEFLRDLRAAVDHVKGHPEAATEGMAAMYGMAARIPDKTVVKDFLYQYMDDRYDVR